jgi:ABC-type sugar transport system substrate-binding protein
MPDAFVSYKHEDQARVRPLVDALRGAGIDAWWDQDMLPGARFPAVIRKVLEEVACVIVAWSARSIDSDWVPDEATFGRDRAMLVPVSLDGGPPPLGFQQLLSEDLAGWDGQANDPRIAKVIAAVRAYLGRREAPAHAGVPATAAAAHAADPAALEKQYRDARNKRVFLIVGSFNEEWQVSLNFQIMQAVQRAEMSCTVLVPTEDHSTDQQRSLLQHVQTDGRGDYLGGFVICSGWPDARMQELTDRVARLSSPIVLVDRNPPDDGKPIPPKISYVSVNDAEGGKLASEAVSGLAEEAPVRRVLVVAGYAKQARHRSFIAQVKNRLACEVVLTEGGKFDRWVSENISFNLLTDALKTHKPFDVAFCTADSMTLGCLDAIARIDEWHGHAQPRVVGYDGTTTTMNLADSRRSALRQVVVQDTRELARTAVDQLLQFHQGGDEKHVLWVDPYLYPRITTL